MFGKIGRRFRKKVSSADEQSQHTLGALAEIVKMRALESSENPGARTSLNRFQSYSGADQSASGFDRMSSDADESASFADQRSSDADQRASDMDQANADRAHAAAPIDGFEQIAYDDATADRARASLERQNSAAERALAERARTRHQSRRDETADHRDETANARDREADIRDRAAELQEKAVRAMSDANTDPLRAHLDASQALRDRAASDRMRAAAHRSLAAADRARAAEDRAKARAELESAQIDALTGVFTRDLGLLTLRHEIERARRAGEPFAVAHIRVVDLGELNAREGRGAGDALLRSVVDAIRGSLHSYDPVVRISGDEFLCGMIDTSPNAADQYVERIHQALTGDNSPAPIDVGVSVLTANDSLEDLVQRAGADVFAHLEDERFSE